MSVPLPARGPVSEAVSVSLPATRGAGPCLRCGHDADVHGEILNAASVPFHQLGQVVRCKAPPKGHESWLDFCRCSGFVPVPEGLAILRSLTAFVGMVVGAAGVVALLLGLASFPIAAAAALAVAPFYLFLMAAALYVALRAHDSFALRRLLGRSP